MISFFIRPRLSLIHEERMIRRALGRCMLLETVEKVETMALLSSDDLDVRIRKRSD